MFGKSNSLTDLISNGAIDKKEAIEEISARATGEKQIEDQV